MASITRMTVPTKLITVLVLTLLWLSNSAGAQITIPGKTYPFNLDYLSYCSTEVQQDYSITPVYRNNAFVYVNNQTGKPLFGKSFQEAYPFVRGYGLVKTNGLYGIINQRGIYVIKPQFPEFQLDQRASRHHGPWIVFGGHIVFGFDGKISSEVPYVESKILMPPFYSVKKGNQVALFSHYGTKRAGFIDKLLLLCDSVLAATYEQAIIMKGGKIGSVDPNGETVIPFEYTAYAANTFPYPGIYGFPPTYYNMPIHFALSKGQDWYYYHEGKLLFESPIKAIEYNDNYFKYQENGLYNYFNNKGELMLKRSYRWLYGNSLALTIDDRLVFLLSDGREVLYYPSTVNK